MEIDTYNLLCVGVGGLGVVRAVQILSWAAMMDGYKVRTAETHGMAQRGGSVASYLRFGTEVEGPLIPRGNAHTMLAFEASEAVRSFYYAGPNTFLFINDTIIIPPTVHHMEMKYPTIEEIREFLSNVSKNIYFVQANELALKAGEVRTINVVMLGILSGTEKIPINTKTLENTILQFVPEKAHEVNKIAFQLGFTHGKQIKEEFND